MFTFFDVLVPHVRVDQLLLVEITHARMDQMLLVEITPTRRLFLLVPRTKEVHVRFEQ